MAAVALFAPHEMPAAFSLHIVPSLQGNLISFPSALNGRFPVLCCPINAARFPSILVSMPHRRLIRAASRQTRNRPMSVSRQITKPIISTSVPLDRFFLSAHTAFPFND